MTTSAEHILMRYDTIMAEVENKCIQFCRWGSVRYNKQRHNLHHIRVGFGETFEIWHRQWRVISKLIKNHKDITNPYDKIDLVRILETYQNMPWDWRDDSIDWHGENDEYL